MVTTELKKNGDLGACNYCLVDLKIIEEGWERKTGDIYKVSVGTTYHTNLFQFCRKHYLQFVSEVLGGFISMGDVIDPQDEDIEGEIKSLCDHINTKLVEDLGLKDADEDLIKISQTAARWGALTGLKFVMEESASQ